MEYKIYQIVVSFYLYQKQKKYQSYHLLSFSKPNRISKLIPLFPSINPNMMLGGKTPLTIRILKATVNGS